MKKKIYWVSAVATVIQMIEAWIWIGVVITVWKYILQILSDTDLLDYVRTTFQQIVEFFGARFTALFLTSFLGIILIYIWRWAISWSSTNWWQTPNNRWN